MWDAVSVTSFAAQEIVDRYAGLPSNQLLPFDTSERYNVSIKTAFEKAGVTYLVKILEGGK